MMTSERGEPVYWTEIDKHSLKWKRDYNNAIADYEAALRLEPDNNDLRSYLERARRSRDSAGH
jgi:hypothetical protein